MDRDIVTVSVFDTEQYCKSWMSENLMEAVEWLKSKLESVPEEFRHSAKIEIGSVGSWEDSHYATIEITYERPETDDEMRARDAHYKARREQVTADMKRQYEQLKAMFEGS